MTFSGGLRPPDPQKHIFCRQDVPSPKWPIPKDPAYRCLQMPTNAYKMPIRCLKYAYAMPTYSYSIPTRYLQMPKDAYRCLQMPTDAYEMPTRCLQIYDTYRCLEYAYRCLQNA